MHETTKRPVIPDEDDFDPDWRTPPKSPEPPWEPELEPSTFFPHPSLAKPQEYEGMGLAPIFVDHQKKHLEEDDEGMGSSLGERTEEEEEDMETEVPRRQPDMETQDPRRQPDMETEVPRRQPGFPIQPTGFIPNSVLVRILWPPEKIQEMEEERYKPPQLSEDQLAQIASRKKVGDAWTGSVSFMCVISIRNSSHFWSIELAL